MWRRATSRSIRPPPPIFSMMICWPSDSLIGGARILATTSIGPPAGKGTTMVTVRVGQSCARTALAQTSTRASAAIVRSMAASPSIRAEPVRLDRAGPSLDLAGDELGEIFRRATLGRRHRHADAFEPLAQRRSLDRLVRGSCEAAHDRVRRSLRKRERAPGTAVEAGDAELLRGRQIVEAGRAI